MEFWDVVRDRHSMRDFSQTPLSAELLDGLVAAAQLAPSSMNSQPWRFYVTTGETRARLGRAISQATVHLSEYMDVLGPEHYEESVKWYSALGDAPTVIVVTMRKPQDEFTALNWYLSMGAAIENLLLAATAEGLGACNVTFALWVRDDLAEIVGAADDEEVVSVVAVGHPGETPAAAPEHETDHVAYLD